MTEKLYELTIIANKGMTVVEKVELEKILRRYGRITKRVVEGVKSLAYPIYGEEKGLFLYYELMLEEGKQSGLTDMLGITDMVMRFLLVKGDTKRERK